MAYFLNTIDAGKTREVEKWRKAPKEVRREINRAARLNPTTEAQAKVNRNRALRKLICLVNANFGFGDFWLTFTYAREYMPTDESCDKDYKKLMAKLRALYKKAGVPFKYIAVYGQPGHRPHIHLLCSKGVDLEEIAALWECGRVGIKLLDNRGQYRGLAEYIFKHGKDRDGKSWFSSRNLIHPKEKVKEINAKRWRDEPTAPKGFMIDKTSPIEQGVNPITGAEYLRYTLIRLPQKAKTNSKAVFK